MNCKKISLKLSSNLIIIDFYYDKEIIEKVKEIPSRRFDPIKKVWNVPLSELENACKILEGFTLEIDPKIYQALDELSKEKQELDISPLQELSPLKIVSSKELGRAGYICLDKDEKQLLVKPFWKDGLYEEINKLGRYNNGYIYLKDSDSILNAFNIIAEKFQTQGYVCTEKAFKFILSLKEQKKVQEEKEGEIKAIAESDQTQSSFILPSSIRGIPYPYQKIGVEFGLKAGSFIIGDDMGLGKTIQALIYAEAIQSQKVLVVCPATLKWNWKGEIEKWTDKSASFLGEGIDAPYQITNYEALIDRAVSYEEEESYLGKPDPEHLGYDAFGQPWRPSLKKITKKKRLESSKIMPYILNQKWDLIILDEAHKIKSQKAKQTKAIQKIHSLFKHHCLLTGTPLLNRPIELFTLLNYVDPQKWNNFFKFAKRYANAKQGRWGWDFSGSSNIDELKELIKPHMIRRKKEEVLPDLPEKTIQVIEVGLNGAEREYRRAEADLISWIKSIYGDDKATRASRAEQLTRFNYLKQICSNAKIDTVLELIENSGNKVIVFSQFKEPLRKLQKELKEKAVIYTGDESLKERKKAEESFQNDSNTEVFLGSIKAGGLGLNLTAGSIILTMDLPWTPGDLEQAESRPHRIGQKEVVLACRLICKDTIEESILALLEKKKEVIGAVLGEETEKVQEGILDSLISQLMNRR